MAKEEKQFMTRFDEVTLRVSDPKEMLGKITAECVCRKWNEDFTDTDTGEIVTVERNEVIVPNHKVLDQDDVQEIQFHMQSGDIKDVLVTNQMRIGDADTQFTRTYIVQVEGEGKLVCYVPGAYNAGMAYQITTDYAEQVLKGWLSVPSIKTTEAMLITYKRSYADDERPMYYQVTILREDNPEYNSLTDKPAKMKYLVYAVDTDEATAIVMGYLKQNDKKQNHDDWFIYTAIKVEQSGVTDIVPTDICLRYMKDKNDRAFLMDGQRLFEKSV